MTRKYELIAQGAEARVYKGVYLGRATIVKERFPKQYRHVNLDERLARDRIKAEARAMVRAKAAGIRTPALFSVNFERRSIYMEHIQDAFTLKKFIDERLSDGTNIEQLVNFIARGLGLLIARLHSRNVVHGDLTTSNVLLTNISSSSLTSIAGTDDEATVLDRFVMIDFGLARLDSTAEDKAVDLYVLERSLLSAHSEISHLFANFLAHYQKYHSNSGQWKDTLSKYKDVQARGRKRLMVG